MKSGNATVVLGAAVSTPAPASSVQPDGTNDLGSLDALMSDAGVSATKTKGKQGTPVIGVTAQEKAKLLAYVRADAKAKSAKGDIEIQGPEVGRFLYSHFAAFCRKAGAFVKSVNADHLLTYTCSRVLLEKPDDTKGRPAAVVEKDLRQAFGPRFDQYFENGVTLFVKEEITADIPKAKAVINELKAALGPARFSELFGYSTELTLKTAPLGKEVVQVLLRDAVLDPKFESEIEPLVQRGLLRWGDGTLKSSQAALTKAGEELADEQQRIDSVVVVQG